MLFLGLGTGLGAALVVDATIVPLELGHLSIGKKTFEDDLGARGLKRLGRKKWEKRVNAVVKRFVSALLLDDVVLGGGNAKKLRKLPKGCRLGDNTNAIIGGFRLWNTNRDAPSTDVLATGANNLSACRMQEQASRRVGWIDRRWFGPWIVANSCPWQHLGLGLTV